MSNKREIPKNRSISTLPLFNAAFSDETTLIEEVKEAGLHTQDKRDQVFARASCVLAWQKARLTRILTFLEWKTHGGKKGGNEGAHRQNKHPVRMWLSRVSTGGSNM